VSIPLDYLEFDLDPQLVETQTSYEGDTVCVSCGAVRNPLETLFAPTGACMACEERTQQRLLQNRMVM